jgi:hypothetical protein
MKNILIILVAALAVGCVGTTTKEQNPHRIQLDNTSQYYDRNYEVYTLEGCEYILIGAGNNRWGSHKGNCKNPIHYKK